MNSTLPTEPGFYWVREDTLWIVAELCEHEHYPKNEYYWLFPGSSYSIKHDTPNIDEIGPYLGNKHSGASDRC
jgi:hypothetical protein